MTDWPIVDVTGRPDLMPDGDWFTLHHSDGTVGLVLPRGDVLAYIVRPEVPHVYVRVLPPDNAF